MKRFIAWSGVIAIFVVSIIVAISSQREWSPPSLHPPKPTPASLYSPPAVSVKKVLFVPYWSLPTAHEISSEYDDIIYFGVTADADGINRDEPGYLGIDRFMSLTEGRRLLTVRLLDQSLNSSLLTDDTLQQTIIHESIDIATEKGFDGIVLDFEMSALAFDSVRRNIKNFYHMFGTSVKASNFSFDALLYGDTFYRGRPYDVAAIAQDADRVLIMAYDFHKARGNPGPNFPLKGKEQYGYDMDTMLKDFTQKVPIEKITVVFGLFGYDWLVDAKGQGVGTARSYSTKEMESMFGAACAFQGCQKRKDDLSQETAVEYVDEKGKQHKVWFEDAMSSQGKERFLKEHGVSSVAFWAYSYF